MGDGNCGLGRPQATTRSWCRWQSERWFSAFYAEPPSYDYIEEPAQVWEPTLGLMPSSIDELAAKPGMGWIGKASDGVRAAVWKVVTLGHDAIETKFSVAERELLESLSDRWPRRVALTPADDVKLRSWDWDKTRRRLVPRTPWRYAVLGPTAYDYEDFYGPVGVDTGND